MKGEYGKYYLLDNTKYYKSVDLQREVKFSGKLAVKCDSQFEENHHFGMLIDISNIYDDHITNNEIIFSDDDIIDTYKFFKAPVLYIDFT